MASKLKAKSPELVKPGHCKTLIYGPSGVGKTWLALSFPAPYFFDTEGGARRKPYQERLTAVGGKYMGPEDRTLDFAVLFEQMEALTTERHPYKTFVVDSITKIYQTCIADEQARLGDKDVFGAATKLPKANMRRLMALTTRLDMNILFIAHETTDWGQNASGQRVELGKTADVFDKLIYDLDLTLQAARQGASRIARIKKSRLEGFKEGSEAFPLDYSEIARRYGKEDIEADSVPIILATAEQTQELEKLLSAVKLKEGEFDKILTACNADTIGELSEEQAASTIKWLKDKISK